jgi:hypothetical protein
MIELEIKETSAEVEALLGFKIQNGMVWMEGKFYTGWTVPRIDHMQKAIEIIQGLLDRQKFERENP